MKSIEQSVIGLLCVNAQLKMIQAAFEWDKKNPWVERGEGGRFGKGGSSKPSAEQKDVDENVFKSLGDRLVNSPKEVSALIQEQTPLIKDSFAGILPGKMGESLKNHKPQVKTASEKNSLIEQFNQWNADYESFIKDLNSTKGKSQQEAIAGKALAAAIPCLVMLAAAAGGGSLFKAASKGHANIVLETAVKSMATSALVNQQLESRDIGNPLTRLAVSAASAFGAGAICKTMLKQQGIDIGKKFKAEPSTKPIVGELNPKTFENAELTEFKPGTGTSKFFKTEIENQEYFVKEIGKESMPHLELGMGEHGEILSQGIGKILGLENYLVPTTSFLKDGKKYVASPMLEGEPLFATRKKKFTIGKASDQLNNLLGDEDIKKIAVFDFLIKNTDRHTGNMFVTKEGLKLIDHELSFGGFQPPPLGEAPALQGVMRFLIKNRSKGKDLVFTPQEVNNILQKKEEMLNLGKEYFLNLPGVDEIDARRYLKVFEDSIEKRMTVFKIMKATNSFSAKSLLGPEIAGQMDFLMNMIVNA